MPNASRKVFSIIRMAPFPRRCQRRARTPEDVASAASGNGPASRRSRSSSTVCRRSHPARASAPNLRHAGDPPARGGFAQPVCGDAQPSRSLLFRPPAGAPRPAVRPGVWPACGRPPVLGRAISAQHSTRPRRKGSPNYRTRSIRWRRSSTYSVLQQKSTTERLRIVLATLNLKAKRPAGRQRTPSLPSPSIPA